MGRAAAGVGRERVLEASLALFAERGVAATSLQMIAERLGLAKAAVYHHFRTKDAIVIAVLRPGLDQLDAVVEDAWAQPGPHARAATVVRGLADIMVAQRRRYQVMMADPAVGVIVSSDPAIAETFARMESALAGPAPSPERRLAVGLFLAALDAPARAGVRQDRELTPEVVHAGVLRLGEHLLGPFGDPAPDAGEPAAS